MSPTSKVKDIEKKSKIFIVDDHPVLRQGLAQLINFEDDMIAIGEASNAAEALKGIAQDIPDLVLVDISLEGTSGLELTKDLIAKYPGMNILIVSMYDESVYVERVLRAGAKGYLAKREASDHVVPAIRKVLGGDIYVSEKWKSKLMHRLVGRPTTVNESFTTHLSDRELEVLQLTGQGNSTRHIAEQLHVSVKTVESHYANIKNKLDLKNSHELIQYAVKWSLSEE